MSVEMTTTHHTNARLTRLTLTGLLAMAVALMMAWPGAADAKKHPPHEVPGDPRQGTQGQEAQALHRASGTAPWFSPSHRAPPEYAERLDDNDFVIRAHDLTNEVVPGQNPSVSGHWARWNPPVVHS